MAFVTNVLTPIIKGVLLGGFILGWIIAMIWLFIKYVLTKKRRLWLKYHVFGKKYDEKIVEWCLDAYEKGYRNEIEIKKILLIKGEFSGKQTEETIFIFSEIKKLKGGLESNDSIRQGSGETEFTKIQEKTSIDKEKGRRS